MHTKDRVHKGLQTKYDNLQAAHSGLAEAQQTWEQERAEFQTQLSGFASEKVALPGQIQTRPATKSRWAQPNAG